MFRKNQEGKALRNHPVDDFSFEPDCRAGLPLIDRLLEIECSQRPYSGKSSNEAFNDIIFGLTKEINELEGKVLMGENKFNEKIQRKHGESAWLNIVYNCKSTPELVRIQNPAKNLKFETKSKGVQYFLPEKEWKKGIKP